MAEVEQKQALVRELTAVARRSQSFQGAQRSASSRLTRRRNVKGAAAGARAHECALAGELAAAQGESKPSRRARQRWATEVEQQQPLVRKLAAARAELKTLAGSRKPDRLAMTGRPAAPCGEPVGRLT